MSKYKIEPVNENMSIQVLIDKINKGYELQSINRDLTEDEILKFNGAVILAPDYQREYRFTIGDEVKLIESVLVGIPIPPIFLATDKYNGVRVNNVVDGQHRLRALYRFFNNEFYLNEELKLLTELEGYNFNNLDIDRKTEFTDVRILVTIFKDFPGLEFELEIFSRYNKGTKPLSPQEIRHAVYNSELNQYINNFVYKLYNTKPANGLKIAYNVTKDRIQKKKVQEGLFVILSILEYGINPNIEKSLGYAESYMEEKSSMENKDAQAAEENFKYVAKIFNDFNDLVIRIQDIIDQPFSKEIYGISSRNYKFQISIAMILAGVFNKLKNQEEILKEIKYNDDMRSIFLKILKDNLQDSFLENPNYKASSTNSKEISHLINHIELDLYEHGFLPNLTQISFFN